MIHQCTTYGRYRHVIVNLAMDVIFKLAMDEGRMVELESGKFLQFP